MALVAAGFPSSSSAQNIQTEEIGPVNEEGRRTQAAMVRLRAALAERNRPISRHPSNGDEELYANKIGNYSKTLPHNLLGEVQISAYDALIHALRTGEPRDFEAIPLAGPNKLQDPQASYAFLLEGADSHATGIIAPPAFASPEQTGEMAEDYWMALTRDVPYSQYSTSSLTNEAVTDLSK
jgi:hypothetical protein